jgi:hypothetical protein
MKLRLPRGGDATSASGRAIVGRRIDRVEMASTPSWARRRATVVGRSDVDGTAGCCRRQGGGRGWSLMGEVVPRCGIGSLVKIVVRESVSRGVMGVQVHMSSRREVRESLLCPSACLFEGALQLKRGHLCVSTRGSSSNMRGRCSPDHT